MAFLADMRVAALGRTHWLYDSIVALDKAGHEVVLIGTSTAAPEYMVGEKDFEELAARLGCPYFCDASINRAEHVELARSLAAEAAISVNWPTLIGEEMMAAFKHGIVNAHAGDLPRFRGNACPNWAILNGEDKVVLTLHQMIADLDAGPIVLKRSLPLTETTYIGDVYRFLERAIPEAYVEAIAGLDSGSLTPTEQSLDPAHSLRCFPRTPEDGGIDWNRPATDIAKLVRASAEPFAGAFAQLTGERLTIWRARAEKLPYPSLGVNGQVVRVDTDRGEAWILCDEGVLVLEQVELEGKRGGATEFIRSTRTRLAAGDPVATQLQAMNSRIEALERLMGSAQGTQSNDC